MTLQRRTPLRRTGPPKRRTPIRQRSQKRADDEDRKAAAYATVRRRAGGRCEIGSRVCTGGHEQTHHRLPRSASSVRNVERHDPELLLATCMACHEHVETHRAEALERGWLVSRYQP